MIMKTIFMFSGQGSQYYHMGSKLLETDKTFRQQMYAMDEVLRQVQGVSVIDELYNARYKLSDPFLDLRLTHPAIFMTGYALARTLEGQGMAPDLVLGSSLGEFAAAAIAGVLSWEDALLAVIRQAETVQAHCGEGRLIAVLQDMDVYHANPIIHHNSTIAAIYSPSQFVIAGEEGALIPVKKFMRDKDILHQELMVSYGFHSPAIDGAENVCVQYLQDKTFDRPLIPMISCVTGARLNELPQRYFWDIVQRPIAFADAIRTIEHTVPEDEAIMYIDLGPSGSLANCIKYNVKDNTRSKGFQVMSPFRQEVKRLEEAKIYYQEHPKRPAVAPGMIAGAGAATTYLPKKGEKTGYLAYVFPGQGSQRRGMGEELFGLFPRLTDRASEILGYDIAELCVKDPRRELNSTQFTQPALYCVNALSFLKLQQEDGMAPDFVAGHSLGEYNALFAAGGLDFETGLRLVQKRGALMATMKEGGMAAVKGLSEAQIAGVIRRHGLEGFDIANYNTYNQIVLSGPRDLVNRSGPHFEAAGASLYFPLNVSGAFHSRYMQPAREQFQSYLQAFAFSPLRIPVISNVEARPYTDDRIGALLADQLIRPVRWTESIAFLLGQGNISLKEVGPGDVLTKLIYSIQKDEAMPVL